jgi:hypothetical protein
VRQLTQIECRQTRLRCIKQRHQLQTSRAEVDESTNDPHVHHHIGQSEKVYDEFGYYLRSHAKDPAMQVICVLLHHYHSEI